MRSNMNHDSVPARSNAMPSGIPYIITNEAAERFSYYGMRTILVVYMTEYLRNAEGSLDVMSKSDALGYYHLFSFGVYLFPILGALLSDVVLGKYRTILSVSLIYCAGHGALALGDTGLGVELGLSPRGWLALGLFLIAMGSGGIKPCVSAHVGDQFGKNNQHLLEKVFSWFYFAINLGAAASQLLTPYLLQKAGPSVAFGVPGLLMAVATFTFWSGRRKFVHIPPAGAGFIKEVFSGEGLVSVARLGLVYVFVAVFWSLFDQTGSAWVLQAKRMDRNVFGMELLPSQIQAINPFLIMVFVPLFTFFLYPVTGRWFELTALRKISIGMFLTVPSFLLSAYIESRLAAGDVVSIGWQLLAFAVMTAAEVLVSITCLEFSYTQAPNRMKSFVMALFLLSVSLGNGVTSAVNFIVQTPGGGSHLTEVQYYLFFAGLMTLAAFGFVAVARRFKTRTYVQGA